MFFTTNGQLVRPLPIPVTDNTCICPLIEDPDFNRVQVPCYLLTEVIAPLVKGPFIGFEVPHQIVRIARAESYGPQMVGLESILNKVCGAAMCQRCIPGVAWGKQENYFVVIPRLNFLDRN